MNNPLLSNFTTPFGTTPFEIIKNEHFKPAIKEAIKIGKEEIKSIKENVCTPDFNNTIEALEKSGSLLNKITTIFFNLNSAETSDEIQAIARDVSPLITAFSNDITLDKDLFKRVESAYHNTNPENLNSEELTLLDKTYKGFIRNGANLKEDKKKELKEINTELSKLSLIFGENVLNASNEYELWLTDKGDVSGLPEGVLEAAAMTAKTKGKEKGWLFTLDYPSYVPFMKYSENRELREKMYYAFGSRAFKNDKNNNEKIIKEIVALRHKRSVLTGYKSHANYILEERMAESPENVYKLLDELLEYAMPVAKDEIKEIENLSSKMKGPNPIMPWDFTFYSEILKKEKFNIDDEILKPYFQLEKVVDGAFQTANKLFDINFTKRNDISTYHEDVMVYEVKNDKNEHLAIFYADFFPREGKRNGAWMTSYRGQNKYDNKSQRPHISIVCNFTKPTDSKPSLLTFNEVTTLFHEFGHALHGILADGHYESLSGTSVYWDFVELPSQIMENWCYEKECLDIFAKHYKTGESIPEELIIKIKESAKFLGGYQTVRQISFGKLDMAWHDLKSIPHTTVSEYEKKSMEETRLFPKTTGTNMSCAFSHIFQGGYSAGYYSYKWAEVLEADAFEKFIENGIFNTETSNSFKENILSKGGSEHPMILYTNFRGRKPKVNALLEKSGLV